MYFLHIFLNFLKINVRLLFAPKRSAAGFGAKQNCGILGLLRQDMVHERSTPGKKPHQCGFSSFCRGCLRFTAKCFYGELARNKQLLSMRKLEDAADTIRP
jgi:translation elongation factor EF-4